MTFYLTFLLIFTLFAFVVERENECYAVKDSFSAVPADTEGAVSVNENFQFLFSMYFWTQVINFIRSVLEAVQVKFDLEFLNWPIKILSFGILLLFINLPLNHVYRLSHNGKVCSGDYLTLSEKDVYDELNVYMMARGTMLWILLVICWIFISAILCFLLGFVAYTFQVPAKEDEESHIN